MGSPSTPIGRRWANADKAANSILDDGTDHVGKGTRPTDRPPDDSHEWNGITELNTRVPRAVWFFIIVTHIWALVYWVLSRPGLW
ncbi:cbb3-type cytochrome c oxidase N-terminal domain-containing protein [Celeribacter sp.]|uniref:cbb3-type cytochrome c oxidase N-terminal domain-containing protein n=1 Tax=Celeribacter sp. TaxID=1890673 RepID=UPI003A8D6028